MLYVMYAYNLTFSINIYKFATNIYQFSTNIYQILIKIYHFSKVPIPNKCFSPHSQMACMTYIISIWGWNPLRTPKTYTNTSKSNKNHPPTTFGGRSAPPKCGRADLL